MTQTHLPPQWRQRLLAIVNGHGWLQGTFFPEGMRFLAAWAQAEGGTAAWNPLNTTLHVSSGIVPWQSSPDYNSAGVCNYKKPTYGVMATAATLVNGFYDGILGDLQNGTKTAEQITNDRWDEIKTWGTNPQTIIDVLKTTAV